MTGDLFHQGEVFGTIMADPPWMERGGGKVKRGADRHYPLMPTADIAALKVGWVAAPDSHLYLWVTNNFLPDGLLVMGAWGFQYISTITWVKDRAGLGQYFRGRTEHLLFGRRGQPPYKTLPNGKRAQGETVIVAPRTKHSEKPPEARAMVERVSHGPFLELFARTTAPGWRVWGNEVASDLMLPP